MKEGIHPTYNVIEVVCACGNLFTTRSTATRIHTEVCSACHPFYTGRQKLLDIAGRVERFQKRYAKTEGKAVERKPTTKAAAKVVKMTKARSLANDPIPAPKERERSTAPRGPRPDGKTGAKASGAKPGAKAPPAKPAAK